MKLVSIFFTASAAYLRNFPKLVQTSEMYKACFNTFHSECSLSSEFSKVTSFIIINKLLLQKKCVFCFFKSIFNKV